MVYYRQIEEKSLVEIMESEFYNCGYYHEATEELKCLPPDVVKQLAGCPPTKNDFDWDGLSLTSQKIQQSFAAYVKYERISQKDMPCPEKFEIKGVNNR
jgi:hypothetical protein